MKEFDYRIIQLINNKGTVLVDAEDYEELNKYKWRLSTRGYASRSGKRDERLNGAPQTVMMHRQIMGLINIHWSTQIDHIYGKKLDNRKSKLRICNHSENQRNSGFYKNSKSGIRGVSWAKTVKKWVAQISHNKKVICLGYFTDKDDAIKARKEGEIRMGWLPVTNKGNI